MTKPKQPKPKPKPKPAAPSLVLPRGTFGPDGRLQLDPPDPSPLGSLTHSQKVKRMLGLLEAAASAGDVSAARDWLAFHRWQTEMRKGRAPQRVAVAAVGAMTVQDSLGGIPGGQTGRMLLSTLAVACGADPDSVTGLLPPKGDPAKGANGDGGGEG